jgi:hypothetical protein
VLEPPEQVDKSSRLEALIARGPTQWVARDLVYPRSQTKGMPSCSMRLSKGRTTLWECGHDAARALEDDTMSLLGGAPAALKLPRAWGLQ